MSIQQFAVNVTSGLDTLDQRTKFEAKQSGVTVALSSAVVSAVQGAAYNTYNQAKDILKDPGKANDISVSVSLGSSKSSASSQDKSTTAVGSQVVSAGSVNVTARNPDGTTNTNDKTANAGNIVIEGSQVIATEDINLNADRDITLLAAGNTSEHSSQNKSSSGSVGASFSGAGISATASASRAKGQADGTSQSSTNTRVQAGGTLTMSSGGDTTMKGATASGNKVTAAVGGNLNLSSLRDTSQYKDKSQSSGFSVSVPITGGSASASVSHSKTSINSNYQSVGEQTAIRAGDGGFDIDVQGKTTLTGVQITSTDKAVQGGKNSFKSAGGLDMQDLQNSAQYDASSYSVSATVRGDSRNQDGQEKDGTPKLDASGKPTQANPQGKPEGSAGFGSDSGQGSSTSTSGISGIAGNTQARTGDQETGLKPLFDAANTKADVQGQVAITAEFGKNASKAWGDFATNKEKELRSRGQHEEADKWREGGTYRAAGHFAIGGRGGGAAGALASGGISLAADKLNSLQDQLKDKLIELGMSPDAAQMFSQGAGMATAGTLGTAAGGTVGGGSAFNTDTNNRQLHPDEKQRIKEMATDKARSTCRGDADCEKKASVYWTDMLERAAEGRVDTQESVKNQAYYDQVIAASGKPGSQASLGLGELFFKDLGEAQRMLNAQAGAPILDARGRPATGTDGKPQTFFSATQAQRDNPYGNIFPGGSPSNQASVIPGKEQRDESHLARLNTPSGQAVPDTTMEEALMGVRLPAKGAGAVVKVTEKSTVTALPGTAKAAEQALLRSGGAFDKAGNPLLDMSKLSNEQKRVVGEQLFGPNTVKQIVPDGQQVARMQGQGSNGIDELYKVNRPDVDYVNIEYKFVGQDSKTGAQVLGNTTDGKQGSTSWMGGSNRIEKAIPSAKEAERIYDALDAGRVESWVVTVRPDGSTALQVLDALGKPKSIDTSKIILPNVNLSGAQK